MLYCKIEQNFRLDFDSKFRPNPTSRYFMFGARGRVKIHNSEISNYFDVNIKLI